MKNCIYFLFVMNIFLINCQKNNCKLGYKEINLSKTVKLCLPVNYIKQQNDTLKIIFPYEDSRPDIVYSYSNLLFCIKQYTLDSIDTPIDSFYDNRMITRKQLNFDIKKNFLKNNGDNGYFKILYFNRFEKKFYYEYHLLNKHNYIRFMSISELYPPLIMDTIFDSIEIIE